MTIVTLRIVIFVFHIVSVVGCLGGTPTNQKLHALLPIVH